MATQTSSKEKSENDFHNIESYEGPPPYSKPPALHFSEPGPPTTHSVSRDQCIAHLKLLSVFAELRTTVSNTDGLFGINDSQAARFVPNQEAQSLSLARIREKRWAVFTSRAADRYATWWSKNPFPSDEYITLNDLRAPRYSTITEGLKPFQWESRYLPPLDVLMVWHAHALNPRIYLEDCLRAGKIRFWSTEFPWQLIDKAIDWENIEYSPEDEARVLFQKLTGRLWENQDESYEKNLNCLRCTESFTVPWTTGDIGLKLDDAFKDCAGYADNSFDASCPSCSYKHNLQTMRVASFRQDVQALVSTGRPMPGSLLNAQGLPDGSIESSFPSRVLSTAKVTILKVTTPMVEKNELKRSAANKRIVAGEIGSVKDMLDIRSLIEYTISSDSIMAKANGGNGTRLSLEQKGAMRKTIAHYWENSSIFGLDLVGAVMRQGTFIQKVDHLDWVHSPTLSATVDKLIRKYGVFFDIMVKHMKTTVPTLDVDLAWHTHQLSSSRYFKYSRAQSRKYGIEVFIDHDDKVDEGKLSEAFIWTCKTYASVTNGEVFSECNCWYCEAVREVNLYSGLSAILTSSSTRNARNQAEKLLNDPTIPTEMEKSSHISAHNAVSVRDASGRSRAAAKIREAQLRSAWEKAHRRAQKSRKMSSTKPSDAYHGRFRVWGHPYSIPFYAPYMCDASINSSLYADNPACKSVGVGSYGNCAAGLCGGSGDMAGCAAMGLSL
ncbi:hypothetical protein BGW36DRAFT_59024 [Talaromyces proteolyticus]|uniref:Alpha-ketoglutarate-dependent sulfonate dioxygenase n=1 Tax=Talaromyces proteolyticus TaxID=1131652 RepID=A0AAD4KLA2_9EURO|nr:uncharacterized protein BGW36DRAFT_59024 [Talaromyces proteolyticus]KAH8690706.1 hypothetical protein BGW36DRAFT_59024 [Talaromyces proteolyticus]